MDVLARASKYLATMEPSVSGSGGHNACFAAASVLVHGFLLSEDQALALLRAEFNPRCAPSWSERELVHKVRSALASPPADKPRGWLVGSERAGYQPAAAKVARPDRPRAEAPEKRQEYDPAALERAGGSLNEVVGGMREYLWQRSPVAPDVDPVTALSWLYEAGERVLVFSSERSQGDFGIVVREPGVGRAYALGDRPGVAPAAVEALPKGGKAGMWFLSNPVDGQWTPNGQVNKDGQARMSRRSTANVTYWRYMVLESDEADAEAWLRGIIAQPFPLAAIYESGSRSVHALMRVASRSLPEWNALRDRLSPYLTKLGADPGALSAVRLTRVPNVLRYGKGLKDDYVRFDEPRMQSLLWLDPRPQFAPIEGRPVVRRR